jgi:hypothetical protein
MNFRILKGALGVETGFSMDVKFNNKTTPGAAMLHFELL